MVPEHEVYKSCDGEKCAVCGEPATHKLAEEHLHEYPLTTPTTLEEVISKSCYIGRSAYVCCIHFAHALGHTQCKLRDPDSQQTEDFWVSQTLKILRQMANGEYFILTMDSMEFKIAMAEDMSIGYVTEIDGVDKVGGFNTIRLEHLHSWVKAKKVVVIPK